MPITVTRVRSFLNDADGDNVADSGDTFLHSITVINGEALALTNLFLTESENGLSIDPGSFKIGPIAIDDNLNPLVGGTIAGNTPVTFTGAQLVANDIDPDDLSPNLTISKINGVAVVDGDGNPIAVNNIGVSNGTVTSNGDGTFTFKPTTGYEGAASFTYDTIDEDGVPSASATPATVSITVGECVWYVDANAAAGGDGSFGSAFQTLAPLTTGGGADSLDDADDTIFVYDRGTTNGGTIVLENGQKLLGDGSSLTSVNGNSVGASTSNSDIGGNTGSIVVTLGQNNTISGIDVVNTGTGAGISGTNFGTLTVSNSSLDTAGQALSLNTGAIAGSGFTSTDSDAGANNVSLVGVGGTLNLGSGTLQGATSANMNISGGDANVTFDGTITNTQGNAVAIDNHDGGTITFNGTVGSSGAAAGGIDITNSNAGAVVFNGAVTLSTQTNNALTMTGNSGGTITFGSAGIDITTTTGTALTFTGGGELNIAGSDNDVTTTTGKLIDINGGTTGTGLNFDAIQSTGSVNGHAVSINNLDADANSGDGVESFTANSISVAGTVATSGGDGVNVSNGASVKFDVNTITVKNTDGDGIELNGANGEVDIDTVNIQATGGQGLEIVGATQLVDIDGGGIGVAVAPDVTADDPNLEAVLISGGNGNIDIGANIAKTTAGNVVEVQNHAGGTINLTGTISATGAVDNGILLNGNGGTIAFTGSAQTLTTGNSNGVTVTSNTANIDFTGGNLDVITTGGTGIGVGTTGVATGGTLTISGASNTITSGTGSALVVNGTDIDNGGITLVSVNKNGGTATGVFLKDTGSSGFFTITGNASVAGSGGTIQNINGTDFQSATGIGIYLENVSNVSLSNLNFDGTLQNYGIRGFGVNNFTLRDSTVDASFGTYEALGGQDEEGAIKFGTNNNGANGLTGTALFEGNRIGANVDTATGTADTFAIFNNAAGTLNFTMRDNATSGDQAFIGKNSNVGNDGVSINVRASTATVLIDGVTFDGSRGDMVQTAVQSSGTLTSTISNNTMHNNHADITAAGGGIAVGGGENPSNYTLTYNISGNSIRGPEGQAIFISTIGTQGTINGVIANNVIGVNDANRPQASTNQATTGSSTGNAIDIRNEKYSGAGNLHHAVRIEGNTITDFAQSGIYIRSNNQGGGSGRVEATILNNTIEEVGPTTFGGISVVASGSVSGDTGKLGLNISGNSVNLDNTSGLDGDNNAILVDQVFATGEIYVPGVDASGNGSRGEAVPPAGGQASTRLSTLWDGPANTLVNGEFPNAIGVFVDATQVKTLTSNAFVLGVPILAYNPGNNGWEIDNPLPGQTGSTGGSGTPAPYVDPTPQTGPNPDPNPPGTGGTGTDGTNTEGTGTGGSGTGGGTPAPAPRELTQAELDTLVEAAIDRWAAVGANADQLAAMRATRFSIEDMPGTYLGTSKQGEVLVDSDGAGHGWFVDATPGEDSEFGGSGTRLAADADGAAAGKMDLLTVLMHELGHQVGLDDIYNSAEADELMYGYARLAERRLPASDDLAGADMTHAGHESLIESSPTVASLPAGKGVVIQYTSTVDGAPNQKLASPFTNFSKAETDNFPDAVSANENLVVDTLTLGGTIWSDDGGTTGIANNGLLDGDEAGVAGVKVTLFADTGTTAGVWDADDTQLTVDGAFQTDSSGNYSFTGLTPGNYIVRVDQVNFDTGGALANLAISSLTTPDQPDPDDNVDGDDNGGRAVGEPAYSKAITLTDDGEPDGNPGAAGDVDGDNNPDSNLTLDFGFIDNPPPVIADLGGDAVTFTEDGPAVLLDQGTAAGVTDDQADLNGGKVTVSITANEVAGEDVLAISTAGTVTLSSGTGVGSVVSVGGVAIGTISANGSGGNDLVIDLDTSDATPARVATLLQALTYSNSNTLNPSALARTVSVTVDDGLSGTDTESVTVNITPTNDAPTAESNTTSGDEDSYILLKTADFGFEDPDGVHSLRQVNVTEVTGGKLFIDQNNDGFDANDEITSFPVGINVVLFTGNQVAFRPDENANGAGYGSLTFTVTEDNLEANNTSGEATLTIDVDPVNDAPTLALSDTGPGSTLAYTENDPATALSPTAVFDDVDSDNFDGGKLEVQFDSGSGQAGDELSILSVGGITLSGSNVLYNSVDIGDFTIDSVNDIITVNFDADADVEAVDALIQAIGYRNTLDAPNTSSRFVNFKVTEADNQSAQANATVNFTATDDDATPADDTATVAEDGTVGIDVVFNDTDADGPTPLGVTKIGTTDIAAGETVTIASGAKVTLNNDGTLTYNPFDQFDELANFGSGASNTTDTDSFTYTLGNGGTATVTVTVQGAWSDPHILLGTGGADDITGTAQDDIFQPGAGADTMTGLGGDDTYTIDNAGDLPVEAFGEGNDSVITTLTEYALHKHIENLALIGAALNGTGNQLENVILGNANDNVLDGLGGADTMAGGAGDDTYIVQNSGDEAIETSAGDGHDTVRSTANFTLGAFVEDLVLLGNAIRGTGNGDANVITGNIRGNIIDGKAGADTMIGGEGDDVYTVDNLGDQVIELGGAGVDTVRSTVSFTLSGGVNHLTLLGTAAKGTGNNLGNIITGNASANTLKGVNGNDTLIGGGGADKLYGGAGHDKLQGDAGADEYHFDTSINTPNVDRIIGYSVADDTIVLDKSIFKNIAAGTLSAAAFHTGAAASDASDRIIYNSATGDLFYDSDGTGAAGQILFARLDTGLALTNADFIAVI